MEEATRLGQAFRYAVGTALIVCNGDGGAWIMTAAGGPRRLSPKEFDAFFERIVQALAERAQIRTPRIDKEFRSAFLGAASILCTRGTDPFAGVVCPACVEAQSFAGIGLSLASPAGAK